MEMISAVSPGSTIIVDCHNNIIMVLEDERWDRLSNEKYTTGSLSYIPAGDFYSMDYLFYIYPGARIPQPGARTLFFCAWANSPLTSTEVSERKPIITSRRY